MLRIVRAAGENATTLSLPVLRLAKLPSQNTSETSQHVKPARKPATTQALLLGKQGCLPMLSTSAITRLVLRTTGIAIVPDSPHRRPVPFGRKETNPAKGYFRTRERAGLALGGRQRASDMALQADAPNARIARLEHCPSRFPYPHTSGGRFLKSRQTSSALAKI
jgi:hypothetical protein